MAANSINVNCGSDSEKNILFFGTDGIRGQADTLLTNELVQKIGYWCSNVLTTPGPVLIGQDSRESSNRIASALVSGLASKGREIWLIGLCPTPAIQFLIKRFNASGGLMISASHNPPKDNGIKIFDWNGEKISRDKQKIIDFGIQEKLTPLKNNGKYYDRNSLLINYENSLLETINVKSLLNIPIALDLCWGSATSCAEKIFQSLGAKVTTINSLPDGKKINVKCGSTHLENIQKTIIETNSEMGFAFDGDADRMIAIDRQGRIMDGDHILYLWGTDLQEKNILPNQRLVATIMSNLGFEKAWLKKGGLLERTPVGDQHVHHAMKKTKAVLGGEQSGHILSKINGLCGDGILTALQLSNICYRKGLNLSEWLDQSFTPFPQRLINIPIGVNITEKFIQQSERFQESIANAKLDMGKEGRIFIRKSGTEATLRIMIESKERVMVDKHTVKIYNIACREFK